ncbi:fungal-specific transcription factor domain-containing protein [Ilyonectria destructans]|nr:fungal-specific transcription factor domain-containing protein [Ilyonectria destructans]
MPDSPAATLRRKHVTMACVPCRVGKVKCDGTSPICSSCKNKGKECRYPTGDDKRKLTPRTAIELLLSRIEQLCQFITDNGLQPPPMAKGDEAALVRVFSHLKLTHTFGAAYASAEPLPTNKTPSHQSPNQYHMLDQSQSHQDRPRDSVTGQPLNHHSPPRPACDNVSEELPTRLDQGEMAVSLNEIDLQQSGQHTPNNQPQNWMWNVAGDLNFNFQPPITVDTEALGGILPFSTPSADEQQEDTRLAGLQQTDEAVSDTESTEALIDKLSERVGSLRIGPSGQIRYYGPFSNFNLMDIPTRDTPSSYRNIRSDGQEYLDHLDIGKEVPMQLEDHLENLYFAWQDPALHVVDRATFEEAKINWRLNQKDTPYYSEALQNSMCSLGAAFESRHHPTFVTFPKSLSDFFADRAKALLEIELDSPSLATIQTMIMLSGHDISSKRDSRGWLYSGMAMRLAFDMALHLDMTEFVAKRSLTQAEADLRQDIFWAAYTVDHMWGFYLGRPFRINMEDVTVEKPRGGVGPESADQWIPYISPRSLGDDIPVPSYTNELHRQRVLMSEIVAPVGYALYGNLRISRNALQVMNAKTVAELLDWKANLPHVLQINIDDYETPYLPQIIFLHMQYHQNIIHAHRPWMSRTYVQPSPAQGPGPGHARMMCMESAFAIGRLLQLYETRYALRRMSIQSISIVFSAAVLLIFANVTHYQCQEKNDIGIHLNACFRALDELSVTWGTSQRAKEFLILLQRQWELKGRSGRGRRTSPSAGSDHLSRKRTRSSMDENTLKMTVQEVVTPPKPPKNLQGPRDQAMLRWVSTGTGSLLEIITLNFLYELMIGVNVSLVIQSGSGSNDGLVLDVVRT